MEHDLIVVPACVNGMNAGLIFCTVCVSYALSHTEYILSTSRPAAYLSQPWSLTFSPKRFKKSSYSGLVSTWRALDCDNTLTSRVPFPNMSSSNVWPSLLYSTPNLNSVYICGGNMSAPRTNNEPCAGVPSGPQNLTDLPKTWSRQFGGGFSCQRTEIRISALQTSPSEMGLPEWRGYPPNNGCKIGTNQDAWLPFLSAQALGISYARVACYLW